MQGTTPEPLIKTCVFSDSSSFIELYPRSIVGRELNVSKALRMLPEVGYHLNELSLSKKSASELRLGTIGSSNEGKVVIATKIRRGPSESLFMLLMTYVDQLRQLVQQFNPSDLTQQFLIAMEAFQKNIQERGVETLEGALQVMEKTAFLHSHSIPGKMEQRSLLWRMLNNTDSIRAVSSDLADITMQLNRNQFPGQLLQSCIQRILPNERILPNDSIFQLHQGSITVFFRQSFVCCATQHPQKLDHTISVSRTISKLTIEVSMKLPSRREHLPANLTTITELYCNQLEWASQWQQDSLSLRSESPRNKFDLLKLMQALDALTFITIMLEGLGEQQSLEGKKLLLSHYNEKYCKRTLFGLCNEMEKSWQEMTLMTSTNQQGHSGRRIATCQRPY